MTGEHGYYRSTVSSGAKELPKCIITVQDTISDVGVEAEGEDDPAAATAAQEGAEGGGGRSSSNSRTRRKWRRCKLATGRRGANQTMLKYLTHKLRTQSINDENHANEKSWRYYYYCYNYYWF
uniref:Uncharacterized protein n=1 Tax=Anopheles atroparvus TaxID=41427 RepID=A0A182J275_ANOAO